MICPKCQSENVKINTMTEVETKHRGCLSWCLWIFLALCTCGLILIIPLITNSKTKSTHKKVAVCQNCGHNWNVNWNA